MDAAVARRQSGSARRQLINSNLTVLFQQGCSFEPGAAGRSSLGCAPPRQHAVDLFADTTAGVPALDAARQ